MHSNFFKYFTPGLLWGGMSFISSFSKNPVHQSSIDTLNQILNCGRGMLAQGSRGKVHEPAQTTVDNCLASLAWLP